MTTVESNSLTQTEVLGDLTNLERGEELVFIAGRREVTVTGNGAGGYFNIQGIDREYNGAKIAARVIANMIR